MRIELELGTYKGFYDTKYQGATDIIIQNELDLLGLGFHDVDITYDFTPIAEEMVSYYTEFYEEFPFISNMKFSKFFIPKYHNYSNDKVYFNCDFDKDLFIDWLISGDFDELEERIFEDHTNHDDFISVHSNKINDWINDLSNFDIKDGNHIYKLGFILSSLIEIKYDYLELDCYYTLLGESCFTNSFNI